MDSIKKYINFYEITKKKKKKEQKRKGKYPFAIFNTDKHNQPGML